LDVANPPGRSERRGAIRGDALPAKDELLLARVVRWPLPLPGGEGWGEGGPASLDNEARPRIRIAALILFLTLLTAPGFLSVPAQAADDDQPRKTLVLPKSPRAAAYVLGRLSNRELVEAPRSEFVYVALLERKGLDRKYRVEALEGLAKARNTDALTELIGAIGDLDGKGEESEPVLRDLASLLVQSKATELAGKRGALEKLAGEGHLPLARQIGYAGLITADGSVDKTWQQAESDRAKLADLLFSVLLLRDASLRVAIYPRMEPLLHQADPPELRRAAIAAVSVVPGRETETFGALAKLVETGSERAAAIAGLQRIPKKTWPRDQVEPLIGSLATYLQGVPADQRTETDAANALQLAADLATLLPPEKARAAGKTLRALGPSVFVVHTLPEQMLYDKTLLVVEPGKPVAILLQNDDAMQHNLVVVSPGALEEIGQAAERMAPQPDAYLRLYVPDSPKVLYATRLLDPGQSVKLAFSAPAEPGEYPYLCTYPGHWRRMVGTLAVVRDVEAYLASHAESAQPKITEWKLEDLAPDLVKVGPGRDLGAGRDLFTKLACAQCHKLGRDGYAYGPELGDVFKRYQNNREDVLRQILEPSLKIDDRYRNYQFELKDGDEFSGMIVKEEADTMTVQTGPSDALVRTLKKSEIKERQVQGSSLMPLGLLNTLSKDQILDLLSYLESGGNAPAHEHQH
jgi:putative heme-binding domain-containing protein